MNRILLSLLAMLVLCTCKDANKTPNESTDQLSTAQKIASAHGFDNWDKVNSFAFTFGGKIEDPESGRSWVWYPKTNQVRLINKDETISYNRNNLDSLSLKADKAFINDKFWALIPFQLVWDQGATISEKESATSPVKNKVYSKITITYPSEGGYTPGDAYDIYFDDEFIIREWTYRKENSVEPTLSNTFENYQNFNGLILAQEHKKVEGEWNLLLRNINVELED